MYLLSFLVFIFVLVKKIIQHVVIPVFLSIGVLIYGVIFLIYLKLDREYREYLSDLIRRVKMAEKKKAMEGDVKTKLRYVLGNTINIEGTEEAKELNKVKKNILYQVIVISAVSWGYIIYQYLQHG